MTITELVKLFIDSRRRGTTGARKKSNPSTIKIYEDNMKVFKSFIQDQGIEAYQSITRMHVVQFLDVLDKRLADKVWAKASCLQVLRSLRTFFRWVDLDEDCQQSGLKGLQKYLPAIEKNPRRTDIPQLRDMKSFKDGFNTVSRYGYRDYVAFCLMADTGVRVGEVCNLRLDNVMLDEHLVAVSGKTGPRVLPITQDMVGLLKGWLKRRATYKTSEGSPYVFISKNKGQMCPNAFGQSFRKHTKKNSLPRISSHTVRHSFCTNYLRQGGDIEKLRMMTGHTTYEMLKVYLHLAKIGGKAMQQELEKVSLLKAL